MATTAARSKLFLPLGTIAGAAIYSSRFQDEETRKTETEGAANQQHYNRTCAPASIITPGVAMCEKGPPRSATKSGGIPLPEFHSVPLPPGTDARAEQLIFRFLKYISGDLQEVCKLRKEKNGVQIYNMKEVSFA